MIFYEYEKKKGIIDVIEVILGSIIMAFGISMFLLPCKLSTGGVSGLATIVYYLFKIPMGITNIILNVPLFIFSGYKIGKSFFAKSIVGTISLSIFMDIFDKFNTITTDSFLACIYGGIIVGVGTAIILRANGSTGGSELASNIIKEYNSNIRMSNVIVMIDVIVVLLNIIFFKEIEIGLYSAISIYIMGKVIDVLFEGIYFTKLIFIVSDKNNEIAIKIGESIKRGTTGLYGKGMYTKKEKLVLMCAAARGDVIKVRSIAKKIDPQAFIIISNAREVFGVGFKR